MLRMLRSSRVGPCTLGLRGRFLFFSASGGNWRNTINTEREREKKIGRGLTEASRSSRLQTYAG